MSEEEDKPEEDSGSEEVEVVEEKTPVRRFDPEALAQGTGEQRDDDDAIYVDDMYGDWFLDYASYVILERAVPHADDGLKPVQRRILHSMRELEDGRYNKVANVIGNTMKYHPHGDASIGDAMIQLGQKDLLIDTQGNWGNLLTGDSSAAPRYIEARLTPFALEVVFSPKVTDWAASYDGRNKEPITFPVKFPLLLAQGAEGIAVGLSTKILPHNFNEILDAMIDALRKNPVNLLPDFPQGGIADCTDYNGGARGGRVRVRAKMEKVKKHLLKITEIPFGTTTTSLIDSILSANDKGKIKVSKIEDNTAEFVEIMVHLPSTVSAEDSLPALYAFTDCEVSLAPNACVIQNNHPQFLSVNDLIKSSAELTRELLKRELEIKLGELREKWHFSSLEKIFIEKRIYRDIEKEETWEGVIAAVEKGLKPYAKLFRRAITQDDILRLLEIRIKRISKYDSFRADEMIKGFEEDIKEVEGFLAQLTRYAIRYFKELKKKYGKGRERKTELCVDDSGELTPFDRIVAAKVVVANETLYLNRKDGFAGYGLKKDEAIEKCSDMDDVLVIGKDGVMKVMKVADKMFVGKSPLRVAVFRRDDQKVYNMVYRDGKSGRLYAKKFKIGGVTRDKEYPLFKTHSRSRIFFFSVHDTEKKNSRVLVHLDPTLKRIKEMSIEFDFAWLELQGRSVKGSTLTTHKVDRVVNAPKAEGEEADVAKPSPEVEKKKAKTDADEKEKAKPSAKPDQSKKEISSEKNGKPKDQATFDFKDN
ncbi:MAG: DNA gyrase/topoisomerase IV subunit A [Verrucomicrobiota bacterium]|nr:DNA gyrase/topoisomerase IV subunit A [Verrucomicrobiota bacterium]MED5280812.1 DNA gyrase/topoisomerase IV subunit A [Verrucomicrobiota bacterium]